MDAQRAEFLKNRIDASPFNRRNGIHAVEVGDGYALTAVSLTHDSMNIWEVPHGGLLFALGDAAAGLAAQSVCEDQVVTVNANINFMAASKGDAGLKARGAVVKKGRSTAFVNVEITDDFGKIIAAGQYVMHIRRK